MIIGLLLWLLLGAFGSLAVMFIGLLRLCQGYPGNAAAVGKTAAKFRQYIANRGMAVTVVYHVWKSIVISLGWPVLYMMLMCGLHEEFRRWELELFKVRE